MPNGTTAFLVIRRDDGFGEVFQLRPGQRCTIGRATTSRIVLKDEMCSREHAEVLFTDHRWYLRDLGSLNGTRLNGRTVRDDAPLTAQDTVELGNPQFVFVDSLNQLPDLPRRQPAPPDNKLEIRARLSETHFSPQASGAPVMAPPPPGRRANLEGQLARLYRLALSMGGAETKAELVDM